MSDPRSLVERYAKLRPEAERLKRWLADRAFMEPSEVAEFMHCSETTVRSYPPEVLPYTPTGEGQKREHRRYDPRDVRALPAVLREWKRAKAEGREVEWLEGRRAALERRDREDMEASLRAAS